jgi:hypothetical protein
MREAVGEELVVEGLTNEYQALDAFETMEFVAAVALLDGYGDVRLWKSCARR